MKYLVILVILCYGKMCMTINPSQKLPSIMRRRQHCKVSQTYTSNQHNFPFAPQNHPAPSLPTNISTSTFIRMASSICYHSSKRWKQWLSVILPALWALFLVGWKTGDYCLPKNLFAVWLLGIFSLDVMTIECYESVLYDQDRHNENYFNLLNNSYGSTSHDRW